MSRAEARPNGVFASAWNLAASPAARRARNQSSVVPVARIDFRPYSSISLLTGPTPPTLPNRMSVAELSLTVFISVSRSLVVSEAPASRVRITPVPGRLSSSFRVYRSSSRIVPASTWRYASTMSGILMTLIVSIGSSAPSATSSPVSRHFT